MYWIYLLFCSSRKLCFCVALSMFLGVLPHIWSQKRVFKRRPGIWCGDDTGTHFCEWNCEPILDHFSRGWRLRADCWTYAHSMTKLRSFLVLQIFFWKEVVGGVLKPKNSTMSSYMVLKLLNWFVSFQMAVKLIGRFFWVQELEPIYMRPPPVIGFLRPWKLRNCSLSKTYLVFTSTLILNIKNILTNVSCFFQVKFVLWWVS